MATDNSTQIADWNGANGQQWARLQPELDAMVIPFGDGALKRAAPQPGERVVDIGCGCGDTSISIAEKVGPEGAVLGVDVSRPMLEVARARAEQLAYPQLAFREADAAHAELPPGNDLLYSRFGVMFFDQPVPAFAHMRQLLRPGGRCVFVCWRTLRDNPWAMTPLMAARKAMNVTPPPVDPLAPGPFAFADDARVRGILADAGFQGIGLERLDVAVSLGATPRAAAEGAVRIGPASRFAREMGPDRLPAMLEAIERVLAPLAGPDGEIAVNGSTWVVWASNPG
jgi:SAM-dependent methyltransferase